MCLSVAVSTDPIAVAQPAPAPLERPTSVEVSFVFWIVLGVLTVLSGLGIAILVAAFFMRGGNRTGRTVLTMIGVVLALPMLFGPAVWMIFVGEAWVLYLGLMFVGPGLAFAAATVLMWSKKASAYFRATRG